MPNYIAITDQAIEYANLQRRRHDDFMKALEVVKKYCHEENFILSISRREGISDPSFQVLPFTTSVQPVAKQSSRIRQYEYDELFGRLLDSRPHFSLDDVYEYAKGKPVFGDIGPTAFESALKRAVKQQTLERVEGRSGFFKAGPRFRHLA